MFISDTMVHVHLTWYNNGTIAHYYYPKLRITTSKKSYSVIFGATVSGRFVTNQFMQLQQLNTGLILILNFAIVYLHFVF